MREKSGKRQAGSGKDAPRSLDPAQGNIRGLPPLDSKESLKGILTSILYRITFHGMGRLRSQGTPETMFATNYPPALQSSRIPDPKSEISTKDLLKEWLPNTGTLGQLLSFYDIFAYNAPYVPLVPEQGAEAEPFFDSAKHPAANVALVQFRTGIEELVRKVQPDWVQIGQWPRNIEL